MNITTLSQIVRRLLEQEQKYNLQKKFARTHDALNNLVSNPSDSEQQTNFARMLEDLRADLENVRAYFEPAISPLLVQIGAADFYTDDIAGNIDGWVRANPITPAVTVQKLGDFREARNQYVEQLKQLQNILNKIHPQTNIEHDQSCEVDFLIPRSLFENQLDRLIKELGVIRQILSIFAEASNDDAASPQLSELSTTDPLIVLGIGFLTCKSIASAITWTLNTWKTAEEIKKLRAQAISSGQFDEEEIQGLFGKKIEEIVAKSISSFMDDLIGTGEGTAGRVHEQRAGIDWALRSLLSRVERGMTVNVRVITDQTLAEPLPEEAARVEAIRKLLPTTPFPTPSAKPVLELPSPDAPEASVAESKPRKRKAE